MKLKRWNWYLPKMTKEQAKHLQEGLLSRFRFQLRLAVPTVGFMPRKKVFWIKLSPSTPAYAEKLEQIGSYVNGFYEALPFMEVK